MKIGTFSIFLWCLLHHRTAYKEHHQYLQIAPRESNSMQQIIELFKLTNLLGISHQGNTWQSLLILTGL